MNKDIAIIGIAGRFPFSADVDEMYENLRQGRDCITDISEQRIKDTALLPDRSYRKCGYMADVDKFDHKLFGISLAEAKAMCPEQRLLLEMSYSAIENSGYSPASLSGSNTAVFVSTAFSGYPDFASEGSATLVTGNSPEFLAAKVGRYFNLKGNATTVDTTCSSSLVAIHTACNELIVGDADMALVAGVTVQTFPYSDVSGGLDVESPGGRSKAFSPEADGMSYGEIAAAVLLKPLEQAIKDNDIIHAVLKGTAANYNGNSSSSITAPDSRSQADVLLKAWKKAGIAATDLSYIEAHGSGTQLGDSLEFEALNLAFNEFTNEKHICPISTIKSNMGHGRNNSGLAGLLKTVVSLKNKVLLPTIHFTVPNPLLDYDNSAVYVNKDFRSWELNGHKRRLAGVTSLGWSGTNCHVVLEEAPQLPGREQAQTNGRLRWYHIPVAGKTPAVLQQNAAALLNYLQKKGSLAIADISYTLATGRNHYDHRLSYVVSTVNDLVTQLSADVSVARSFAPTETGKLIFIFSDGTALSDEIIQSFQKNYETFSSAWNECDKLVPVNSASLKDFAFQYSFYRLLSSYNVIADHLLPIGIGKLVLQVVTNEMSLAEGLKEAKGYVSEEISNKEERVKKLLARLAPDGNCTFLDMTASGSLSSILAKHNSLQGKIYFAAINEAVAQADPLVNIIHVLYSRNFNVLTYPWTNHLTGKRIELPAYRFEKTRCWLRDTPKVVTKNTEGVSTSKQLLKEKAGYIETKIAELFAETLNVREISIQDDFFNLGGDSLKATKVILKLNEIFHVSLDFEDMFDLPVVANLAAFIQKQLSTARKVVLVWEAVLQNTDIQPEDDFFELGGHSLMATQMIVLLNKEFGIELNFEDVFRHPTAAGLTAFIDSVKAEKAIAIRHEIKPAPQQESYRLTYAQKRMWFLNYFVGGNSAYNNVFGIRLEGPLDYTLFDKAFIAVIEKHESLRTVFRMAHDEPRQFIVPKDAVKFRTEVVTVANNDTKTIDRIFSNEFNFVFDLEAFPLLRSKLLKTGENEHICILNIHHIISDGWSMGVFLEDFYMFYEQLLAGKPAYSPALMIQIKDYAEWQYEPGFQNILDQQRTYWLSRFTGSVPVLSLPVDRARPVIQSFQGDAVYFVLDTQQTDELKRIARESNATLYMVLLSVYNILLSKLSNSDDIIVGSPVAGRRFDGLQALIGLFVNTIAIRNAPIASLDFTAFLNNVKQNTLEAFNNQDYPYEELVKNVLTDRDTSRNPLFDAMFIFQNNREVREYFGNIKMSSYPFTTRTARVDLVMEAMENENGLGINFEYCTALFNKDTINRFIAYFRKIVASVIADTRKKISDIEIITSAEKQQVLHEFNNTRIAFPKEKTISRLFEQKAAERGEHTAITFEGVKLSYQELNARSNRLARKIISTGVAQESIIGIMMHRSAEMLVSILAVLKAGCAYVPIDPEYPVDRIRYMITDSGLTLLLTEALLSGTCEQLNENIQWIDVRSETASEDSSNLAIEVSSSSLAYMIYTSGSTGLPKGVMIMHSNVVNFVEGVRGRIQLAAEDRMLCLTTISFDIFVLETILPLLTGSEIVLAGSDDQRDPVALTSLIKEQHVNFVQITPSHLKLLLSGNTDRSVLDGIKALMVGGEAFPPDLLHQVKSIYKGNIYNMYGPTETTVWSTMQDLTHATSINIGTPLANTTIRIMDESGKPQPVGIAGELYIGGEGVARGYWKREELTAERFVKDPYADNERIYRTGDQARWLKDGTIEYLGRIDNQVKIRGFRIELGEIESRLKQHAQVKDAVVSAKEKAGDKFLVAYYVAANEMEAATLREHLAAQLPYYMVPSYFVKLDAIPLTPNGKADRRALPDPEFKAKAASVKPVGEIEEQLADIWSTVLHIDKSSIGTHDDFFSLGGHSIIAVRLIHNIQQQFSVSINLRKIFEYATIARQARLIEQSRTRHADVIVRVEERAFYPASSAQEGLFYEHMLDKNALGYNIYSAYKINGDVDVDRISNVFQVLINRHESLRTGFALKDERIVQYIKEKVDFKLNVITAGRQEGVKEVFENFVQPFDLSNPPLLRCSVLLHEKHGNFLFVDIHHIVCDGISLNILMNDFKSIYNGQHLQPLELRYVDYACWQKEKSNVLQAQREFWMKQLSGELPQTDLPVMQQREYAASYAAAYKMLEIDGELYRRVKEFTASQHISDYMFLLSVYYILLSKMSGNPDVIIGTDVIGRTNAALSNVVGTFVNVLPLRVQVSEESSFEEFLNAVKHCVLESFDNQDLQFDQIVSMLQENGVDRKRIVDVHFSFANYLDNIEAAGEEEFSGFIIDTDKMTTQYEFKIQVNEGNGKFRVAFIYSTDLYEADTIELLKTYYNNILTAVIDNSTTGIGSIELENASMSVSLS
jgi:amino acid adenylation domain-containing protein